MKGKKVVVTLMAVVLLVLPPVMIASAAEPGDPDTAIIITDASLECGSTATSRILVSIVNQETDPKEVGGVEVHLTFDPNLLQVLDADGDPGNGAQLTVESDFFDGHLRIVNRADNEAGTIVFAVTQSKGTPLFNATEKAIATITWECAGKGPPEQVETEVRVAGNTSMFDPAGYPVAVDSSVNGTITIFPSTPPTGCIEGYVFPQGRYDLSGVRVEAGPYKAYTDPTGYFKLEGVEAVTYEVQAEMDSYLDSVALGVEVAAGECPDIGATKLLGGDVSGDGRIDISDITYIASRFGSTDPTADVNDDGVVNILDLAMAAANHGRTGPASWLRPVDAVPWTKDPYTAVQVTEPSFGCGETDTSQILVSIANNQAGPRLVHGVEVHLSFDPTKLKVVDVDPGEPGVQIAPEPGLFPLDEQIIVQEVDNTAGTILFVVTRLDGGSVQEATDAPIATITWEAAFDCATMTEEVCSEVRVLNALMSDPDGYAITVNTMLPGTACIEPIIIEIGCITGSVQIQGHDDHSGATVTAGGASVHPDRDGNFRLESLPLDIYTVQAEMYGYLDSVASGVEVAAGECPDVGATKLLGGDVSGDGGIDISDITYIASRFGSTDPTADVNGDGVVNVLDLAMAAANHGRTGPTSWLRPVDPVPWTKDPYTTVQVTEPSFGCGETDTSQILVSIANNLAAPRLVHGVEVHLRFDPTKLQVVDADPGEPGVQIAPEGGLFPLDEQVIVQEVDNTAGTILFVVTRLDGGSVQEATDAPIATITWEAAFDCATTTEEVCSEVRVLNALMSDSDGYAITVNTMLPGIACIEPIIEIGCITGSVQIQGHDDHSGATVTAGGPFVHPDRDGNFRLENLPPDIYTVQAEMDGYLDVTVSGVQVVAGEECTDIGATKLLGGDVSGDGGIDISDITYIASRFRSTDPTADVNDDGVVDIRDLTIVVVNSG